ncbi:hypothetical protein CTAYLR_003948 [Chrysophaeum taylorii]|uniref:HSF-type DNA-binding domain-containing protein n=1 Tax=Chrysophaeum taylorii TaxID=2483200 RepID=A0AAD7U9G5_9STRA|nr:hypothetical protein CTAYLR_003948 [Chrysophaeum taylorii]
MPKLVSIIQDHPTLIRFEENSIVIPNPRRLEAVLDRYFRHRQYSSFQRQLNNFGFNKIEKSSSPLNTTYVKVRGACVSQVSDLLHLKRIHSIPTNAAKREHHQKAAERHKRAKREPPPPQPVMAAVPPPIHPLPPPPFCPAPFAFFAVPDPPRQLDHSYHLVFVPPPLPFAPPVEFCEPLRQREDPPEPLPCNDDHFMPNPPSECALPLAIPLWHSIVVSPGLVAKGFINQDGCPNLLDADLYLSPEPKILHFYSPDGQDMTALF